jgi:regulator of replication initiation timing
MAGKLVDKIKVTHEEVMNQLAIQIASLQIENTVIKIENQKMKQLLDNIGDIEVPF